MAFSVSDLTLKEKCALLSGVDLWRTTPIARVGIPAVKVTDGPHGIRCERSDSDPNKVERPCYPATCFPPEVTLASSWNTELVGEVAAAIGREGATYGADTVLGPGINIKRNPLCGRNFEYFSEDPFLSGEMGKAYVKGVQSEHIGACVKHFACNNQEYKRYSISSETDERTTREIYLRAFSETIRSAKPYAVMCAYNRVNGTYCSSNKRLLTEILRNEWKYEGIVVSDWGATDDRVEGVRAGLNLEMPSSDGMNDRKVEKAVKKGILSEKEVDECIRPTLRFIEKCTEDRKLRIGTKADFAAHYELAVRAACEGAVLLKRGTLPLAKQKIIVIGKLAKEMRIQGCGSSGIQPFTTKSFLDVLDEKGIEYDYADGYTDGTPNEEEIAKATALVEENRPVLAFIGLTYDYEGEGYDRVSLELPPSHIALTQALCETKGKITAVLSCGSPVTLPFLDRVDSVLNLYLGGEGMGESCYRLLFGEVNPSGKLAETFPSSLAENPYYRCFHGGPRTVEYRDGIFVGYRYYDAAEKEVLFPFGFGLSYTEFRYGNLRCERQKNQHVLRFSVQNIGKYDGSEVCQAYLRFPSGAPAERQRLCAFNKVFLKAGEEKEVTVTVSDEAFDVYSAEKNGWVRIGGEYVFAVGGSSRDIRLTETTVMPAQDAPPALPTGYKNADAVLSDGEYYAMLGRVPYNQPFGRRDFPMWATFDDAKNLSFVARICNKLIRKNALRHAPASASEEMRNSIGDGNTGFVLRSVAAMSNGRITALSAVGVKELLAGRPLRGVALFLVGLLTYKKSKKKIFGEE